MLEPRSLLVHYILVSSGDSKSSSRLYRQLVLLTAWSNINKPMRCRSMRIDRSKTNRSVADRFRTDRSRIDDSRYDLDFLEIIGLPTIVCGPSTTTCGLDLPYPMGVC